MSEQFDASQTSQVVKFFRNQGRTIIPIRKNTKFPKAATGDVEKWKVVGCTIPIADGDSIAMLHGQVSGTWASDLDDPTILDDLLIDNMQKSKMLIVKTPRRGHHIIWEFIPDDYPPKDTSFHDKDGRTIDIKCKGCTLLPPSSHPDTEKKYEFLENTSMVPAKMKWSDFELVLSEKGFFTQNEVNGQNSKNDYDIDVLLLGKFPRGTRRISENSLYCKLRNKGYPKNLVEEKIHEVNSKCDEPLTEQEVKRNCQYAENYFQNVVKTPELKNNQIRKTTPVLLQDIPLDLDLTLEAVKYVRSPVYKAKLKRLTKENPEYLTVESIKTDLITDFLDSIDKFDMSEISQDNLKQIAEKILSWDKDLEYNLAMEFVKMKLDFAHIVNTSENKDFNCSVYDKKSHQWTDKAADQILDLLKNAHLEDLRVDNKMALNLAKDVSGENSTLKVYKDEAYRNQRINMIIDTFGNYFDLKSGALCKINPELHYFETADVKFDLEKGTEEPTEFIAFLKDRFGDDKWEIVRDHLAGTFLGPNLGQKTKLLFIVGSTDTWKSFLLEGFADLFSTEGAVSNVSLSQMADDKVFGPATIVNRFLNYSEETKPENAR